MKAGWIAIRLWRHSTRVALVFLVVLFLATSAFAQANGNSPWENAVGVLQQAFTSTIARGLSLVAIVVSGLTFAFGEGGSKRVLAGVLFGVGMAIPANHDWSEFHGVVLAAQCGGGQEKPQNLRIGLGSPAGKQVQHHEDQHSAEQAVEQIERARAEAQGEKEKFSLGPEDGERPRD